MIINAKYVWQYSRVCYCISGYQLVHVPSKATHKQVELIYQEGKEIHEISFCMKQTQLQRAKKSWEESLRRSMIKTPQTTDSASQS